jgi:hypothetical protein
MFWDNAKVHSSTDFRLHAWVDESMRHLELPEPMYLLGAVIADPDRCDGARDHLRGILPKGARKLHWHQMQPKDKTRATEVINTIDAAHLVVVATPLDHRKQERARAACMEQLLWQLSELSVSQVFLGQRTQSLNERDMKLVRHLRGKRSIPSSLRVDVQQPSVEPMLWVPDQVLGAIGDAAAHEDTWLTRYGNGIDRIDIRI